ncbi:membrane protein insertion efficiency factor YidD [Leucobacter exalbidus]|uniref:membrane protein insertion efficiency factor YidD n=1 Tax=Leucobacter exalbidus TaxID=662960 RepID=UPI001AE36C46
METKSRPLGSLASFAIKRIWQDWVGPRYNEKRGILCRFYPSCSQYSRDAFEKYGFIQGFQKMLNRVRRCTSDNTDTCIDYP